MKCFNIFSESSIVPTYRNIEDSVAQAIRNRSTILIDNEDLYHEIKGELFINNDSLDIELVEPGQVFKFDITYVKAGVMLFTNSLDSYDITNVSEPMSGKYGTIYNTVDGSIGEVVMQTHVSIKLRK